MQDLSENPWGCEQRPAVWGSKGFPGVTNGEELTWQYWRHKRHGFDTWIGKIPWRRKWQPNSVFLPGESQGQRSLVGYSTWGCKELGTTKHVHGAQRVMPPWLPGIDGSKYHSEQGYPFLWGWN